MDGLIRTPFGKRTLGLPHAVLGLARSPVGRLTRRCPPGTFLLAVQRDKPTSSGVPRRALLGRTYPVQATRLRPQRDSVRMKIQTHAFSTRLPLDVTTGHVRGKSTMGRDISRGMETVGHHGTLLGAASACVGEARFYIVLDSTSGVVLLRLLPLRAVFGSSRSSTHTRCFEADGEVPSNAHPSA